MNIARARIRKKPPSIKAVDPKPSQEIAIAPEKSLKRIVDAAATNLATARLAEGLLGSLLGRDSRPQFPGRPAGLREWSAFPAKVRKDVHSLISWALSPARHDLSALYRALIDVRSAVGSLRRDSSLGKRFRARARRLMHLYPPLSRAKWRSSGTSFSLLTAEVGKPLTDRVVDLAKAFMPSTLEILRHDAPLNSTWTPGVLSVRLDADGYSVSDITFSLETPKPAPRNLRRPIEGELIDFFETGTEGVIWMLEDDCRHGRDALETICEGDNLTIMDQLGAILWRGTIRCDKEKGRRPYPMNPEFSQQCALGCWVHWIQEGFEPDEWAKFFMRADSDRLRGFLRKKRGPIGAA